MKFYLLASAFFLSACSMTLPVNGNIGNDRFLGEATGYLTGKGKIQIRTENNDVCDGKFKYTSSRKSGSGTFYCESGRDGTFQFTSSGTAGRGFGKTSDGEKFNFTFGNPTARVESF